MRNSDEMGEVSHRDFAQDMQAKRLALALKIKELRVSKGLSKEELFHMTRISPFILDALESGEFSKLPGEVFGRGFLRSICKLVNTDSKPFILEYNACFHRTDSKPLQTIAALHEENKHAKRAKVYLNMLVPKAKRWIMAVSAVLIAFIILGRFLKQRDAEVPQSADVQPAVRATPVEAIAPTLAEAVIQTTPLVLSLGAMTQNDDPILQHRAPLDFLPEFLKVFASFPQSGLAVTSIDESGNALSVNVKEKVTIRMKADQNEIKTQEFEPGDYRFSFDEKLDFFVFDSAAVDVEFNKKSLGEIGKKGQPKRMSFYGSSPAVKEAAPAKRL